MNRTLAPLLAEDLLSKMVFLAGPRQVGKTTLAKTLLEGRPGAYFTWDRRDDRRIALDAKWPTPPGLIVLDEFHKHRGWKRWLKGEYDAHKGEYQFLLTGSARLDVYRKGGDSLQGRYHHHRLHPFTVSETQGLLPEPRPFAPLSIGKPAPAGIVDLLLRWSGFPEPLVAASERVHSRWQKERLDRFFREDVRDLERIQDLAAIELMADMLPGRVGSPLSLESMRGDLDVSHKAVSHWMAILERLYHVFRISPYTTSAIRGLKKQPKAYLWDSSLVADAGARFENLVALHLFKLCHHLEDAEGKRASLHYLRDVDKREVDFLVAVDRRPWFAVEAKLSETDAAPALRYFAERLRIPFSFQVVRDPVREHVDRGVHVLSAARFLVALP